MTLDGGDLTASCTTSNSDVTCTPPALSAGSHSLTVAVRDLVGHPASASETFQLDLAPPVVTLLAPASGALVGTPTLAVSGTATDDGQVQSVTVNGQSVSFANGQYGAQVQLTEGLNTVEVVATDTTGKAETASAEVILDTTPPDLKVSQPLPGGQTNSGTVTVKGTASDPNGIAEVDVDGHPAALVGGLFTAIVPVAEGSNLLAVHAVDRAGNVRDLSLTVSRFTLPTVTLTAPADLSFLAATTVDAKGTVSDPAATVTVNGQPAVVSGGIFVSQGVPLVEGGNVLTATATTPDGHVSTATINVVRDLTPPRVSIDSPADGAAVYEPSVVVSGLVNDIVPGTVNAAEVTLTVNGVVAAVANRSFSARVSLVPGDNVLAVRAVDLSGNVGQATSHVRLLPSTVPRVVALSGDDQSAVIGTLLPHPLVVELRDAAGQPVAGAPVVFEVKGNNGSLDGGRRALAVISDASGQAAVHFTLGTHAGLSNQVVEASAVGFPAAFDFRATALPGAPARIVVDSGDQQVGTTGQPLPHPLVAAVTDAGFNRLPEVPVRLTVVQGNGHFAMARLRSRS